MLTIIVAPIDSAALQSSVEGLEDHRIGDQGQHRAAPQGCARRLPSAAGIFAAVDAIIGAGQQELRGLGDGEQSIDPPSFDAHASHPRLAPVGRLPDASRRAHADEMRSIGMDGQGKRCRAARPGNAP